MSGAVKGWCPGALCPMESGDGLVLRVRPHGSRLDAGQARGLADLAERCGNGGIDLGSRAHLQLRGIRPETLPEAQDMLARLGLLDADVTQEAERNILTTPVWDAATGPQTLALVAALEGALAGIGQGALPPDPRDIYAKMKDGPQDCPPLPPKFGFAVDTARVAVLGAASADIRIERGVSGGLILRADGMAAGEPVSAEAAPGRAVALARWFAQNRGDKTRMARLVAAGVQPPVAGVEAPCAGPPVLPGPTPFGLCLGLPFGQIGAAGLRALAVAPLRLTPWRSVIVEGGTDVAEAGLIRDAADPLLRIAACTGAPGCASARAATRDLARRLAHLVPAGVVLHVSGCGKGCAHPGPADLTLTARDGRFDLIPRGRAADPPALTGLSPDMLSDLIRGHLAP